MDWQIIAELATGLGTLALAAATFSSVRSANRSAKISELSFLNANSPLLIPSKIHDSEDKINFFDNYWAKVKGGHAHIAATKDAVYMVISLRNAGQGLAVLDRWSYIPSESINNGFTGSDEYRRLTRDLYVAGNDTGLWQGAIRDPKDQDFKKISRHVENHESFYIDIQYGDQGHGQITISRFAITPIKDNDWLATISRHWRLDGTRFR